MVSIAQDRNRHYRPQDLESSKLPKMRRTSSIRVHNLGSRASDVFPANQLMHSWTCCVDRVKHYEVAIAVTTTLKANDCDGMARTLKINWWQKRLVHAGPVADGCLSEVAFDSEKK